MQVLASLKEKALHTPDAIALEQLTAAESRTLTYAQLQTCVCQATHELAKRFRSVTISPKVALLLNNGIEWVAADLACLHLNAITVPIPLVFNGPQVTSLIQGADLIVVDQAGQSHLDNLNITPKCPVWLYELPYSDEPLASVGESVQPHTPFVNDTGLCKIIHTSGTTSQPKGVCIRREGLDVLLTSLYEQLSVANYARYLSLVPLSLLIEQVTAVYMTLLRGGTLVFLPSSLPLLGTSSTPMCDYLNCIQLAKPSVLVTPPVLVNHLYDRAKEQGGRTPELCQSVFAQEAAPFIACGGAPIATEIVEQLAHWGIPVYEGYGLSENSSVVSWNSPAFYKPGTVGKPLAHVETCIREGELWIRSASLFAGYTHQDPSACHTDEDGWLATGDLAEQDSDGFITIKGRKKNVIITAAGRNISPEWVERQYKRLSFVSDVVLFGEGLSELQAVFFIDEKDARTDDQLNDLIVSFGVEQLSKIERVRQPVLQRLNANTYDIYFTVTGRAKRNAVFELLKSNSHINECKLEGDEL